jgi:VWFA-related protein
MNRRTSIVALIGSTAIGVSLLAAPQRGGRAGGQPPPVGGSRGTPPPTTQPQGGRGQQPQPPQTQAPVFKAGVELVQVDVVVRDQSGLPIHGLLAEDFVVLDRGKPQQIGTFKAVRRERDAVPSFATRFPPSTRLDTASNQTSQAGRIIVMVLDDLHAYRGRDDVVKKIATQVVQQLGDDSLMALLMTSGDYNVEVTEDRSRLLAAIDKFKGARLVRRPMLAVDNRRGGDLQEFDANMQFYNTLENAARLFRGNDGRRKAFVLISENLAKDLSGILQSRVVPGEAPQGGAEYIAGNLEFKPLPNPETFAYEALEMVESMRRSNVVTYAIDPRGHVPISELMRECQPSFGMDRDPCLGGVGGPTSMTGWVGLAQQGLVEIAGASGGFAIVNTDDFTEGIDRVVDDLDNYYLLGFYPEDTKSRGYRRLEVQVRERPDLQLRYRRGYEIGLGANAVEQKNKDPLFALIAGALPNANVPLRLGASVLPGSGKDARIPLALEVTVPRQSLEEADARLRDQIRYAVTVVDMKGAKVKEANGYGAKLVLRPRVMGGNAPNSVTYQIGLALNLPPGRYHLRASASSTKLEDGGSVYLPIDVPDFTKERLAVSGLVLGYGSGPRVPAVASSAPARAAGNRMAGIPPPARGTPPPIPGNLPVQPTLDREFLLSDDVILYFEVIRKDRSRELAIMVTAVDGNEKVIRHYAQKMPPESLGKVSVRLPLKDIGSGAYRLRVQVADGTTTATNETAILIK